MTQIAIKGHTTRGEEIIKILEMLGGINLHDYNADCDSLCYYSEKSTDRISYIYYDWVNNCYEDMHVFTLEEFLEKYPYKVGDKVFYHECKAHITSMKWDGREIIYTVECNKELWETTVFFLQSYKEETMDKVNKEIFGANAQCCDISNRLIKEETMEEKFCIGLFPVSNGRKEIIPCDGYEVVSDGGKFYVVKKSPQYPKTHVECCEILYPNENFQTVAQPIKGHHGKKLFALQKLLVCRDAYWKIAGEQMELDEPWKPNWGNDLSKYYISFYNNRIDKGIINYSNKILAFPTEEMRDAFYENFKDLIESCKELL